MSMEGGGSYGNFDPYRIVCAMAGADPGFLKGGGGPS